MISWYLAFPAGVAGAPRRKLSVAAARRRARLAFRFQAIAPVPRLRCVCRTAAGVRFKPIALRPGAVRLVDVTPTGAVWIHGVV